MKKPAPWNEHDAGRGCAFSAHGRIAQGPCVNAARSFQKLRLDTGKAGVARPAVGIKRRQRTQVERPLWDLRLGQPRAKAGAVPQGRIPRTTSEHRGYAASDAPASDGLAPAVSRFSSPPGNGFAR